MNFFGIIQRYLISAILKATFVVFLIAVAVISFVEFANEARDIGSGSYGLTQVLIYIPMILPADVYSLFPMIGLLGVLIGLGLLSSSNELLIMRASGLSILKLMVAVLVAAFIMGVFAFVLGEVVSPHLSYQAKNFKQQAMTGNQSIETESGIWMHVGNDFLNITQVVARDHWLGVTRYHFDDQGQLVTEAWAKNVEYKNDVWLASQVSETQLFQDHTKAQHYDAVVWPLALAPSALAYGFDDATEMSLSKLHQFIQYRAQADLPLNHYLLDFWRRVLQPLAMVVMMMLAIPFVFVSARSGAIGVRVLLGVIVSMGFYLVSQLTGQFSIVFFLPAWVGALLPIAIFFVLSIWLLRRVR